MDKNIKKIFRIVDLIVPAQNAKLAPPVGPILGQVKIKVKDFCTQFNQQTINYPIDLPLRVFVTVFKNETFVFNIKLPTLFFLIQNILNAENKKNLNTVDFLKLIILKKRDYPYLTEKAIARSIYATIKSLQLNIIF